MRLPLLNHRAAHTHQETARNGFDARSLEDELQRTVEGEVRFDAVSRAAYSTDASNYRRVPAGVVVPRTTDDVVAAIAACRQHGAPLVTRGGGTSLNGQCCTRGVAIDCSKYLNNILDIDPDARTARVQPGVVLDTLREQTIDAHGLAFAPDPSTHSHCTFGGMIGNNACGVHSVLGGRTSDNVLDMEIATSDGLRLAVGPTSEDELARRAEEPGRIGTLHRDLRELRNRYAGQIRSRFPDIPRRVSGYNLPDLLEERGCNLARALVGSEGTCVAVLEATVRLVDWPKKYALLVLGYPSVYDAGDHIPEIMEAGPVGLEGLDSRLVQFMKIRGLHPEDVALLPDGEGWLLVEFGGDTTEEADEKARALKERLEQGDDPPHAELIDDPERANRIWEVRESGLGATAFVPGMPDTWPGWEDAAVPPDRVGPYLRDFRKLLNRFGYDCALYGHFGQGCIHCRIDFDLTAPDGIDKYHRFVHEAADLVVSHGGSLSAEHGDGLAKSELLPQMYGNDIMQAFQEFKRIWDPVGIMNPGKIADAPPVDTDLRLGAGYTPRRLRTEFAFPDSEHTFERAALRCVGVGKCRRRKDAFMCPSYTATQEEIHTTRGRARLLFEMVRGDFIKDAWRSEAVKESLDLCLACKGCKKECPVEVDMASYKSEFLHHHYKRRLRPRDHYAMGHIGVLADLASVAPGAANFFATAPALSSVTKWLAGMAPDRQFPRFARQTFQKWFRSRPASDGSRAGAGRLLLLPDAFNDHFYPDSLKAAVFVLERLGYRVEIPPWRYPAIRPLIHYGFLPHAQRLLETLVARLDGYARDGIPIVGLEPSSVAVLRDEISSVFPKEPATHRIQHNVKLLSEFLAQRHLEDLPDSTQNCAAAIFHAHCHQKADLQPDAARKVLRHLGLNVTEPEPGCCGMAGSFGFERKHAHLSRKIGEANLFPAIRNAGPDTPIIVEGFSCREQIRQDTPRRPTHLAEFVAEAMGLAPA